MNQNANDEMNGTICQETFITDILQGMMPVLNDEQLRLLKSQLYIQTDKYELTEKERALMIPNRSWEEELRIYMLRKHTDGRSESTLQAYSLHLRKALTYINKSVDEITETDLSQYLSHYKYTREISNNYLDGIRLVFSSFFTWLNAKGLIHKNPAAGLDKIKKEQRIKLPYSNEELERIRNSCRDIRELALVDFLYSTGLRISEVVMLNRQDIDFVTKELIAYGKGAKDRETYLNASATMHLQEYLKSRDDDNPALFVSLYKPHNRMSRSGLEEVVKKIGIRANVENVHPHRFRRTMATNMCAKGVPVQEVSALLGHAKLDTTMIYCKVNQSAVKASHNKFMNL